MTSSAVIVCWVCKVEETNSALLEICGGCGNRYHLNPYHSRPGIDCGDAWLDDEELALQLFCTTCMDQAKAQDAAAWVEQGAVRGFGQTAAAAAAPVTPPSPQPQPQPQPRAAAPNTDGPPPIRERIRPARRYRRVD